LLAQASREKSAGGEVRFDELVRILPAGTALKVKYSGVFTGLGRDGEKIRIKIPETVTI